MFSLLHSLNPENYKHSNCELLDYILYLFNLYNIKRKFISNQMHLWFLYICHIYCSSKNQIILTSPSKKKKKEILTSILQT